MNHTLGTILLLEDNAYFCRLCERVLKHAGYEVKVAHTIQYAKLLMHLHTFDLWIFDLNLSDGNSLSLVREYNSKFHQNKTKLILMSGSECEIEDIEITHFLQKPFSIAALIQITHEIFRQA